MFQRFFQVVAEIEYIIASEIIVEGHTGYIQVVPFPIIGLVGDQNVVADFFSVQI